jgi:8-oxo-dGTP pyrophosphatase MutT (NUDIX family)
VVCVDDGALLCVRLRDPVTGERIDGPPGGGIEPGETPQEAALRETLEETGYRVQLDAASETTRRYPYTWAGKRNDVLCYLYRARLLGTREARAQIVADPIQEAIVWLPLPEVRRALEYLPPFRDDVWALANGEQA